MPDALKTILFCSSYAESRAAWDARWGRWLQAVNGPGINADRIMIVDDGSPVMPDWNNVAVVPAVSRRGGGLKVEIHHFPDRLGHTEKTEFCPGWYRCLAYGVRYAIQHGFDRIIYLDVDAFLISDRATAFFNTCDQGWAGLWNARLRCPEIALQIINKDQFAQCEAFFSQPLSAHPGGPDQPIERLLPLTSINKTLIGDRYSELGNFIPYGADYVSKLNSGKHAGYYWWMSEHGAGVPVGRREAGFETVVDKYGYETVPDLDHPGVDYRDFMTFLDRQMLPRGYLEIGTHRGDSLVTMSCDAICIDPDFQVPRNVLQRRKRSFFFQMTSDEFFGEYDSRTLIGDVDVAFLDGLHYFEALLKDFINFERQSHPTAFALLHDCLPLNTRMAGRTHQGGPESESPLTRRFWTGDVWRVLPILQEFRPDLRIILLDCPPTGLVVCSGLDNTSTTLSSNFAAVVDRFASVTLDEYGLRRLWTSSPMLSTRKILADPQVFCEYLRFRN